MEQINKKYIQLTKTDTKEIGHLNGSIHIFTIIPNLKFSHKDNSRPR